MSYKPRFSFLTRPPQTKSRLLIFQRLDYDDWWQSAWRPSSAAHWPHGRRYRSTRLDVISYGCKSYHRPICGLWRLHQRIGRWRGYHWDFANRPAEGMNYFTGRPESG